MFKRLDGGNINELTKGSNKIVIYNCENKDCQIEVKQIYKTFILHKEHFCRKCRNKHTANRNDVKEKQSITSKMNWSNIEYRQCVIKGVSNARKNEWMLGKRKAFNKTKYNTIIEIASKKNYKVLTTKDEWETKGINKINIKCEDGHIFSCKMNTLKNCTCNKCRLVNFNKIIKSFESENYILLTNKNEYKNNQTHLKYICPKKHIHQISWSNWILGHRCPKCLDGYSQSEQEVKDFIKSLNFEIIENDRKLISPLEIDIIIPEKKIAIEYCGLYWHGELKGKNIKYHLHKLEECNKVGYKLITIFSDEWINKKEIVKQRLKHILGINDNKIYARKCVISEITTKQTKEFIEKYHIQGYTGSQIKLGAFYDNKLVAVMTFAVGNISKGSKNKKHIWELSRFCMDGNVIGVAGKLLTYFKKHYKWNDIFSYADRRWSSGNLYEKIGFKLVSKTKPNYWYFKNEIKRIHRFNFRKNVIKHLGNSNQTEWEIMKEQGYDRIWDCGNLKYWLYI